MEGKLPGTLVVVFIELSLRVLNKELSEGSAVAFLRERFGDDIVIGAALFVTGISGCDVVEVPLLNNELSEGSSQLYFLRERFGDDIVIGAALFVTGISGCDVVEVPLPLPNKELSEGAAVAFCVNASVMISSLEQPCLSRASQVLTSSSYHY